MTIYVSKDTENAIDAAVKSGRFASADEMVDRLVREYDQRNGRIPATAMPSSSEDTGNPASDPTPTPTPTSATQPLSVQAPKPFWERILERTAAIPSEEWDKLPSDLAEQHDHYIYGTPKRPAS